MVISSGLVSLNIHEALTFEGTEICLHPDLFSSSNPNVAGNAVNCIHPGNNGVAMDLAPNRVGAGAVNFTPTLSRPPTLTNVNRSVSSEEQGNRSGPSTLGSFALSGGSIAGSSNTPAVKNTSNGSNNSNAVLQFGDMIEIRVWDLIKRTPSDGMTQPSNTSSIIRPRISIPATGSLVLSSINAQTTDIPSATHLPKNRVPSTTTNNSLQYSDATSKQDRSDILDDASYLHNRESPTKDSLSAAPSSENDSVLSVGGDRSTSVLDVTNLVPKSLPSTPVGSPMQSVKIFDPFTLPDIPVLKADTNNAPTGFSVLPPVFPRNRTAAADSSVVGGNNGRIASKRSAQVPARQLSNPAISGGETSGSTNLQKVQTTTNNPTAIASHITNLGSNNVKSQHYRELSDITAETVTGATAHSLPQNPIILDSTQGNIDGPRLRTSQESFDVPGGVTTARTEDEEDGWTYLSTTHTLRLSFVMLVTEKTLTSLKGPARTQVSILRQVAELYKLSSYDMITINKVEKNEEKAVLNAVSADFVLVTIKDQFISRGDMHYFQKSLTGSWLYEGQRLLEPSRGFQAIAQAIRHSERQARSGIVTDKTTVTFRSRSARIIWLVQMSAEMWDYASPYERGKHESLCEIYFDKWISFIHELFVKWKELEATHSLTVIYFSRTFIKDTNISPQKTRDVYGRPYEDHFRPVIENVMGPDWDSVVLSLKKAFVNYPFDIGWNLANDLTSRRPSTASQGNVLEAINVTLNLLQFHYLDRDIHRTGNSIVLISAGNGVFEVDQSLSGVTYQRMMDNGIGSDMLSLGLPALHIAPFFLYNKNYGVSDLRRPEVNEQYYEVPHWMHLSFVSYESDKTVFSEIHNDELKEDRPIINKFAELEIRANGFLLPRAVGSSYEDEAPGSPFLRPTSFSLRGNAAASPVKKTIAVSSERQLIAGRDFRDILEACRPRNAGAMPSPLKAVLEANGMSMQPIIEIESIKDVTDQNSYKEWDTLESEEVKSVNPLHFRRRSVSLGQEPTQSQTYRFGFKDLTSVESLNLSNQPTKCDDDDLASIKSQASSVASQVSSSVLGASYDRPYLIHKSSRGESDVLLQRPDYLNYDLIEDGGYDTDTQMVGDTLSDDDGVLNSRFENSLRRMMEAHDYAIAGLSSTNVAPTNDNRVMTESVTSRNPTKIPVVPSKNWRTSTTHGFSTGGIGAALQQHKSNAVGHNLPGQGEPTTSSNFRNTSTLTSRQRAEMTSKVFSPSLLPNVSSPLELSESLNDGRWTKDKRFVNSARVTSESTQLQPNRNYSKFTGARTLESHSETRNMDFYQHTNAQSFSVSPPNDCVRPFGKFRQSNTDRLRVKNVDKKLRNKLGKKAFNPFQQHDEEEVLAKKSHNRRRWSHVFPLGEVEFKRHAGPNWKSLSAPAILPLAIDYFPTQEEIRHNFTFSLYNVTLSEFERKNYSSNRDLLMEMVRQRITQDFQLVSEDNINACNYRQETLRDGLDRERIGSEGNEKTEIIRQFLSMGHRLQVLTYDASADIIEVKRYTAINTQQNDASNTFKYEYLTYCQETRSYSKIVQTFDKYSDHYNWNKVDRIICGDEDRELREGMRFRRLMFGIIPDKFVDKVGEEVYIAKFRRLLEYLNKLRDKDEFGSDLRIKFVSKFDIIDENDNSRVESAPGIAHNAMQRFYVQIRKGKRDTMEWIEVVVDSTFNTSWSYRIIFNWLVASSGKVDTQVQLLQRRCSQYGLNLIPFPQITVSRNLYLYPFKPPVVFTIRSKAKAGNIDSALDEIDFLHDGKFYTDVKSILECIDNATGFLIPSTGVVGRQFVHRTGTLFVRIMTDRNGFALIVVVGNYRYLQTSSKDENALEKAYRKAFLDLTTTIESLKTNST